MEQAKKFKDAAKIADEHSLEDDSEEVPETPESPQEDKA